MTRTNQKNIDAVPYCIDEKLAALGRKLNCASRHYGRVTALMTRGRMRHDRYEHKKQGIKRTCYEVWIEFSRLMQQRRWFDTDL